MVTGRYAFSPIRGNPDKSALPVPGQVSVLVSLEEPPAGGDMRHENTAGRHEESSVAALKDMKSVECVALLDPTGKGCGRWP